MPTHSHYLALAVLMLPLTVGGNLLSQTHADAVREYPAQTDDMDWGQPRVTVSTAGDVWTIAGVKNTLKLNAADFSIGIISEGVAWNLAPSETDDIVVQRPGAGEINLRLQNS